MTGSGKSVLAKKLALRYGLRYVSGGDALKEVAKEAGFDPYREGWWESEEGLNFLSKRLENPEFDKKVDEKLIEMAKTGNVVFDSWTMPWLLKAPNCFKVWLKASIDVRARRVAKRDKISVKEAMVSIREKDKKTASIYRRLYGFRLGEDYSPFDLILDNSKTDPQTDFEIICAVIDILRQKGILQ
jgi:cytidylate kinase